MRTDSDWIAWSQRDPYFAVLTQPQYRLLQMDSRARETFFEEGRAHVAHVLATIRAKLDPDFHPTRAVDFGCGVGRIVLPLLDLPTMQQVVGVDIAPRMLQETQQNCSEEQLQRFQPLISDASLEGLQGDFDLVHSCIVFQHIPPNHGMPMLERLLARVRSGGVAVIQLPFGRDCANAIRGQQSRLRRWLEPAVARSLHWLHSCLRRGTIDPVMEMHAYPLNEVFYVLQCSGYAEFHAQFTDHGGALGLTLYAQRMSSESTTLGKNRGSNTE